MKKVHIKNGKDMMKELKKLLQNPPQKKIPCPRCAGEGFFVTGAISTRTCPNCGGVSSPYIWITNYTKFATMVKKLVV